MSPLNDPQQRAGASETEPENEGQADPSSDSVTADTAEVRAPLQEAQKIARLEAELEEFRKTLIHRQADFENFRKRVDRERREDRDRAVAHLAESLLPVIDNFERALAAHQDPGYEDYRRGFAMIYRQLADLLAHQGVVRMQDPSGQRFDPRLHHALEKVETSDFPEGTVIEEVQAGYKFHDRVLRPAQVRVAASSAKRSAPPPEVN